MYCADEMVPKRENGQAANRRLTRHIMLASLFHHATHIVHVHAGPGCVAQSLTCLATIANPTADPGVASSIPARSHTFVEIDHEINSTVILLPSVLPLNHSWRVAVSYKRKYVHELLVNCLFKLVLEKVWLGELAVPPWPKLLTWDVKQQNKP